MGLTYQPGGYKLLHWYLPSVVFKNFIAPRTINWCAKVLNYGQ